MVSDLPVRGVVGDCCLKTLYYGSWRLNAFHSNSGSFSVGKLLFPVAGFTEVVEQLAVQFRSDTLAALTAGPRRALYHLRECEQTQ